MKGMYHILVAILSMCAMACVTPPDYPDEPEITFEGWSTDTMDQGNLNNDSVFIFLSFTDGDGDIGYPADSPEKDIFVVDGRTGSIQDELKMPEVPEDGTGNGINGDITLRLFNTCCIFPRNIPPCSRGTGIPLDSLFYEIYIVDRAGNESNRIITPTMYLRCN
jgi:hypothetical protein